MVMCIMLLASKSNTGKPACCANACEPGTMIQCSTGTHNFITPVVAGSAESLRLPGDAVTQIDDRILNILLTLAKQNAPRLLSAYQDLTATREDRIARVARGLASNRLLVLVGMPLTRARANLTAHMNTWVGSYKTLYDLLAGALFPSYTGSSVSYSDPQLPLVVVFYGQALPVVNVLAGYIVPYIATRQTTPGGSEAELWGLLERVLDELAADDLPRSAYHRLRGECATQIKLMLNTPIRQIALHGFDQPVLAGVEATMLMDYLDDDGQQHETGAHPPTAGEGSSTAQTSGLHTHSAPTEQTPPVVSAPVPPAGPPAAPPAAPPRPKSLPGTGKLLDRTGAAESAAAPAPATPEPDSTPSATPNADQAPASSPPSPAAPAEPAAPPVLPGTGRLRPDNVPRRPPVRPLPAADDDGNRER